MSSTSLTAPTVAGPSRPAAGIGSGRLPCITRRETIACFPTLAGKVVHLRHRLHLAGGGGIRFVVAEIDDDHAANAFRHLVPALGALTQLRGSVALGMAMHYAVVDGRSVYSGLLTPTVSSTSLPQPPAAAGGDGRPPPPEMAGQRPMASLSPFPPLSYAAALAAAPPPGAGRCCRAAVESGRRIAASRRGHYGRRADGLRGCRAAAGRLRAGQSGHRWRRSGSRQRRSNRCHHGPGRRRCYHGPCRHFTPPPTITASLMRATGVGPSGASQPSSHGPALVATGGLPSMPYTGLGMPPSLLLVVTSTPTVGWPVRTDGPASIDPVLAAVLLATQTEAVTTVGRVCMAALAWERELATANTLHCRVAEVQHFLNIVAAHQPVAHVTDTAMFPGDLRCATCGTGVFYCATRGPEAFNCATRGPGAFYHATCSIGVFYCSTRGPRAFYRAMHGTKVFVCATRGPVANSGAAGGSGFCCPLRRTDAGLQASCGASTRAGGLSATTAST
ncbi:hypothetical protein PR202_ga30595 [Eleusine coracana subsp. coracana]|uniref:Uncharacterized protein n=1 Tax=Eleusine coracana subsp. coracana TaxID=191504 RepID=A0AAV5DQ24_ELECO|nr:hypothetical protein PR202_ga30595 [Eleusine coracana subsp. coracana]